MVCSLCHGTDSGDKAPARGRVAGLGPLGCGQTQPTREARGQDWLGVVHQVRGAWGPSSDSCTEGQGDGDRDRFSFVPSPV